MNSKELTDAEIEAWFLRTMSVYGRQLLKAPIIAAQAFFIIAIVTSSIWKAAVLSVMALAMSAFSTWRRFLEPIVFWAFIFAVIYWCNVEWFLRIKTVLFEFFARGSP